MKIDPLNVFITLVISSITNPDSSDIDIAAEVTSSAASENMDVTEDTKADGSEDMGGKEVTSRIPNTVC